MVMMHEQPHTMTQPNKHIKREINDRMPTKLEVQCQKSLLTYYEHSTLELNITAMFYQFQERYILHIMY